MTEAMGRYVSEHVERGECKCGRCKDVGDRPDPAGHTVDMIFFKVALKGPADAVDFERLTREHRGVFGDTCDPLDGHEHGYMELGGWIGDQGLALEYMALGTLLGIFELLTPRTMLREPDDDMVMEWAGAGFVTVTRKKAA